MNADQAAVLSRLAHSGQRYGRENYFEGHILKVVDRCASHKHCTYAALSLAYLHDIVEDTDVSLDDLRILGLDTFLVNAVDAITKRTAEDYAAYITRVLKHPTATFVKYHDLQENAENCRQILLKPRSATRAASNFGMTGSRAKYLLTKRYGPAIDRIIQHEPPWLDEAA